MKKDLLKTIEIPAGVNVSIHDGTVTVSGNGKEVKRKFDMRNVEAVVKGNELVLSSKDASKREGRIIGTLSAHISNMIKGMNEEFVYKLEICNVHFPMTVKIDKNKFLIKTFLGETIDRVAEILPTVKVDVKGSEVTVSSHDLELAGQTAANIEQAARLIGRDRRVFQDGIFITEKCGRKI